MSKRYRITLTSNQSAQLERVIHQGQAPARTQTRARILFCAASGQTDAQIAHALRTSTATVQRTRQRFVTQGLDQALTERPRSGRPPLMTGEVEADLTLLACSQAPDGRSRWTLRLFSKHLVLEGPQEHVSHVTIYKTLKKTNSSPGR